MASSVKDSEVSSGGAANNPIPTGASRREDAGGRAQPVALEVPVTVNGARSIDGSEKREPFSEKTKTVLIFANGAVVRLGASVSPGQLLFLTNENTKREVVSQVVKSKNYRNVSGYVELEFTEAASGFWGMRFPGERTSATAQPPAAAPMRPAGAGSVKPIGATGDVSAVRPTVAVVPPEAGVKTVPPQPVAAKPEPPKPAIAPVVSATPVMATPETATLAVEFPQATERKPASFLEQPQAKFEPLRHVSDTDTEALKQEAARLQAQLSTLLFAEAEQESKPRADAPKKEEPLPTELAKKVLEAAHEDLKAKPAAAPPAMKEEVPATKSNAPAPRKSTLDLAEEEVKIPAWLEPLARNAAARGETAQAVSEPATAESEPLKAETGSDSAPVSELTSEGYAPTFGAQILLQRNAEGENLAGTRRSGRGLLIGALAAGLVVAAAGGAWYYRTQTPASAPPQTSEPKFATLPGTTPVEPSTPTPSENKPEVSAASGPSASAERSAVEVPVQSKKAVKGAPRTVEASETAKLEGKGIALASSMPKTEPAAEPQKKAILGNVQLAAPVVNSSNTAQTEVAAPGLNLGSDPATSGDAASAALMVNGGNQPKVPVPIGGDVKPARLIHGVPPVYPALARSQHVAGDVMIDAFIDATGHVTAMKILSGPVLLHQAAKDAVKQWRYQPAMLDGKPVSMHLNVKVQFRVQQ
jgi:TonB family protein